MSNNKNINENFIKNVLSGSKATYTLSKSYSVANQDAIKQISLKPITLATLDEIENKNDKEALAYLIEGDATLNLALVNNLNILDGKDLLNIVGFIKKKEE